MERENLHKTSENSLSVIADNFENLKESLTVCFQSLVDSFAAMTVELVNIANPMIEKFSGVLTKIAYYYADSKIVHLAKYGKNKRIRKKNHKKAMQQGLKRYLELREDNDDESI